MSQSKGVLMHFQSKQLHCMQEKFSVSKLTISKFESNIQFLNLNQTGLYKVENFQTKSIKQSAPFIPVTDLCLKMQNHTIGDRGLLGTYKREDLNFVGNLENISS